MISTIWENIKKPFAIIGVMLGGVLGVYFIGKYRGRTKEREHSLIHSFEEEKRLQNDVECDLRRVNEEYHDIVNINDPDRRAKRIREWADNELGKY